MLARRAVPLPVLRALPSRLGGAPSAAASAPRTRAGMASWHANAGAADGALARPPRANCSSMPEGGRFVRVQRGEGRRPGPGQRGRFQRDGDEGFSRRGPPRGPRGSDSFGSSRYSAYGQSGGPRGGQGGRQGSPAVAMRAETSAFEAELFGADAADAGVDEPDFDDDPRAPPAEGASGPLVPDVVGDGTDYTNSRALDELPLHEGVVSMLRKAGVDKLFPVQVATLPAVQDGRDLVCKSPTGSGKTLAFAVPLAHTLRGERAISTAPQVLVVCPTRELARQVGAEFDKVGPRLRVGLAFGGVNMGRQIAALNRGVHVLVGTPGRIMALQREGHLDLASLRTLVLDEADEMLDFGFREDLEQILMGANPNRQTLLWSATLPDWVQRAVRAFTRKALIVDMTACGSDAPAGTDAAASQQAATRIPRGVRHIAVPVGASVNAHAAALTRLIDAENEAGDRALIFTNTKADADALGKVMAGLSPRSGVAVLHGGLPMRQREHVLDAFRAGTITRVIATDVAARGIDVPDVRVVAHAGLAQDAERFVHRSGRTARAGRKGTNLVLYLPDQAQTLAQWRTRLGLEIGFPGFPAPVAADGGEEGEERPGSRQSLADRVRAIPFGLLSGTPHSHTLSLPAPPSLRGGGGPGFSRGRNAPRNASAKGRIFRDAERHVQSAWRQVAGHEVPFPSLLAAAVHGSGEQTQVFVELGDRDVSALRERLGEAGLEAPEVPFKPLPNLPEGIDLLNDVAFPMHVTAGGGGGGGGGWRRDSGRGQGGRGQGRGRGQGGGRGPPRGRAPPPRW